VARNRAPGRYDGKKVKSKNVRLKQIQRRYPQSKIGQEGFFLAKNPVRPLLSLGTATLDSHYFRLFSYCALLKLNDRQFLAGNIAEDQAESRRVMAAQMPAAKRMRMTSAPKLLRRASVLKLHLRFRRNFG